MRRLRQDDTVQVLSGKDRGKRGQIRQVLPERQRVIVQGVLRWPGTPPVPNYTQELQRTLNQLYRIDRRAGRTHLVAVYAVLQTAQTIDANQVEGAVRIQE